MKHKFVLPTILTLVIGIACNLTGSPEPLAEEDRIATSVAETVAAQTNQEIEPTHTYTPASSTPLPAVTATPTQNLTVLPTATQTPTMPSATPPPATETPSLLAVGDTIYFDPFAMTLAEASLGNSFDYVYFSYKAREGYTYVYLDFDYVVTQPDPKSALFNRHLYRVDVKDQDGDTYSCGPAGAELIFLAQGYGGYFRMFCEAPLTAISSLDNVQLTVMPSSNTVYTFELARHTQNPVEVSVEKEHEKHFPMNQPFTITCGTQYNVEYVFANPRWSDLIENQWGFKRFSVDLLMTNPGKTNARRIDFRHALFFEGIGDEESFRSYAPTKDRIRDFPIPGGSGLERFNFALPPTKVVPLIAYWPQQYFDRGCELKIGTHVIKDNLDYFVVEIESSGVVEP